MQTETGKHDDQILVKEKHQSHLPPIPQKKGKERKGRTKRPTENNKERGLMTTVDQSEYETTENKQSRAAMW
jgi:hypothetical protein